MNSSLKVDKWVRVVLVIMLAALTASCAEPEPEPPLPVQDVESVLLERARVHPNISLFENHIGVEPLAHEE